ncbi:MAG TPA: glycosyltransferase family 4 protein, partial [Polyangia bacterium]|nr:glycosyltransferase family 4 protein [Polyangia bacterium]
GLARGKRHLAIAHGSDVRLLHRLPGGDRLMRHIARRADLVYVADALRVAGAPGRVVPMGLEVAPIIAATDGAARERARRALGVHGVVVVFLGRLVAVKGVDLLIEALPADVTLLVAGDGPERTALQARANDRRAIRFLGHVAGAAKLQLLAAADVLAIPSRDDGAPTVALEALAAGLPIVATRAGGLPELLDERTTRFAAATAPALAAALRELAHDAQLRARLGSAARALAPTHDWSHVGPALWGDTGAEVGGCIRVSTV